MTPDVHQHQGDYQMANRKQQPPTPSASRSPAGARRIGSDNPTYNQDEVLKVIDGYATPGGSPNLRTGNDSWSRPRVVSVQEYAVGNQQTKQ